MQILLVEETVGVYSKVQLTDLNCVVLTRRIAIPERQVKGGAKTRQAKYYEGKSKAHRFHLFAVRG